MSAARWTGRGGLAGVSLVESLVALLLTLGLGLLLTSLAASTHRGALAVAHDMEVVEARRLTRDLVGWVQASGGRPREGEGLRTRFFIGWAQLCAPGPVYHYQGRRNPDPGRDSVWWVAADGAAGSGSLQRASRDRCQDGERGWLLEGADSIPLGVVLRIFESGRFTLTDALRYGREGTRPQPLTAAVMDASLSDLRVDGGSVHLELTGRGDSVGVHASRAIRP